VRTESKSDSGGDFLTWGRNKTLTAEARGKKDRKNRGEVRWSINADHLQNRTSGSTGVLT